VEALAWFKACVTDERPDAVVMTGDLTMRARKHEFEAAGDWLASLGVPVTVEVGNHDLPYFNPIARFTQPYKRYKKIERLVEQPLEIPGVTIIPLRTTARFQWRLNWSKGRVSTGQLKKTLAMLAQADQRTMILVACHHPLIEQGTRSSGRTSGGAEALAALAKAGADAVLTGHVHDPFDVAHRAEGRVVRLIGAGTLSERVRESAPSFNELRMDGEAMETIVRTMSPEPDKTLTIQQGDAGLNAGG
jgi:3',5'-cyclic AMP phosphodiesterase CpdA